VDILRQAGPIVDNATPCACLTAQVYQHSTPHPFCASFTILQLCRRVEISQKRKGGDPKLHVFGSGQAWFLHVLGGCSP
jgi:hypothetical protein